MPNVIILVLSILITIIIILNIKQNNEIKKLRKENKELYKYSKTNEELITKYRMKQHENKNKLIIIKGMVPKTNKEALEYLNYLIKEDRKIKNKHLNELKYINCVSLKNFINYKINILEEKHTKIELFISEELKNINFKDLKISYLNKLYTILGVMLDNIIDEMDKVDNKLVSINIYITKNIINIELANTYKGKINLKKINKLGFSTKGKEHGVGLNIVKRIIKNTKNLQLETKIEDNFFIQHLKINELEKYLYKK